MSFNLINAFEGHWESNISFPSHLTVHWSVENKYGYTKQNRGLPEFFEVYSNDLLAFGNVPSAGQRASSSVPQPLQILTDISGLFLKVLSGTSPSQWYSDSWSHFLALSKNFAKPQNWKVKSIHIKWGIIDEFFSHQEETKW